MNSNYGKIERNQSNLSFLRLEQIAEILELSPSDILAFDEKMIFQNCNTFALINNGTINTIEKEIYLKKIEFLESKVSELEKLLEHYKFLIDKKYFFLL